VNDASILVKQDEIDRYQQTLEAYLNLQMDADRFMAARLQQGVYGQRQDGVNMVRVKVPGGRLRPRQLLAVADVLEQYAQHNVVHITTRQDFQVHYVPLQDTPATMRRLAKDGLTTREACGNTVRNITCSPLSGLCPTEHVDITPFMDAAVAHFLRHPLTQHLPRKFKISFSGCEHDCAQGMMHDLAVVAVKRDGRFGFKIMAGGGLGHKPHEAITVEPFIEEKDLLPSMEAVISLHHRYSDRTKRAKSRIKFLVDRFGPEGFVEKYREEFARTKSVFVDQPYPKGEWTGAKEGEVCGTGAPRKVTEQKQPGLYIFPISIPIGDITGPQLRGIARLMEDLGLNDIRTTQDQNLILTNVPAARINTVRSSLTALGLGEPKAGDNVVACPGTSTCRLGITSSKIIAVKLNGTAADLRIRVSGCHNGCAQPETGDIGIYGEGKRLHGKLIPHYQMYFGGDGRTGGGLAIKGPEVPAVRIEEAVKRVQEAYLNTGNAGESFFHWTRRQGKAYFDELLAQQVAVSPEQVPLVLKDHGDESAFKVLQLGGGECAGAAQELVAANFAEAAYERDCRNAFIYQRKHAEAIECAESIARLIGQSVLFVVTNKKTNDLAEIIRLLPASLPNHSDLAERFVQLNRGLAQLKQEFDESIFPKLMEELDVWVKQAADVCMNIDRQVDLTGSLAKPSSPEVNGSKISAVA